MGLPARNTRWVVAAAVVVALAVGLAGFRVFQGRAPDLVSPGAAGTNRFVAPSQPETSYVVEGIDVCLDRPGAVTIRDVAFVTNQGGTRVTAWGVRPRLATQGSDPSRPSTLDQVGQYEGGDVSRTCGAPTESSELALEVRKSAPGLGRGFDLRITYDTGMFTRELEVEMDVVLCGPEPESTSVTRACSAIADADAG